MAKPRALVTRAWPEETQTRLAGLADADFRTPDRAMTADEWMVAATLYDAILPTVSDVIPPEFYEAARGKVRILANYGVGHNHINLAAAQAAGITVTNTPGVLTDCTADLAMGLMLAAARRIGEGERELRAGRWAGWRPTHMIGRKVSGATLGIVGFGRIGQAMAQRAHHGFGMRIIFQNRSRIADEICARYGATQMDNIEEVAAASDVLSLHCPGGPGTRHIIGAAVFQAMKPGCILVNTARGDVVDETALFDALDDGIVGAAGLDVFQNEPSLDPRFLTYENCVLAPHLGSATQETRAAMGHRAIDNLSAFLTGLTPPDSLG